MLGLNKNTRQSGLRIECITLWLSGAVNPSNVIKNVRNQNHLIKHFFSFIQKRSLSKRTSCLEVKSCIMEFGYTTAFFSACRELQLKNKVSKNRTKYNKTTNNKQFFCQKKEEVFWSQILQNLNERVEKYAVKEKTL